MYELSPGQRLRRATTATSILDVAAHVGLFVGMIFWSLFFWSLIVPVDLVEVILAIALAAGYTVVLPMLISLLFPSTPAGMLLAQTRWKTFGHGIAVAAALYMSFHAFMMLWAWWAARPNVLAAGQDIFLAIGTAIIFIIVPALSWAQTAPDRWVAEVIQARQVQRLKAAQQANIMAAQIQYARALALLKRGLANATAAERAEVAGTLIAMQRAENEALGQVADQMRILTGIDGGVSLLDSPEMQQQYEQLTTQVERLIAPINEADYVEFTPRQAPVTSHQDASQRDADAARHEARPRVIVTPHQDGSQRDEPRNDAPQHPDAGCVRVAQGASDDVAPDVVFLATARERLVGQTWTVKQLAGALEVSESQARHWVAGWIEDGQVDKTNLRGHYSWRMV